MIIIPLGGTGQRFKDNTHIPKALIPVFGKPIISWLLDNLFIKNHTIYIPYNYNEYKNKLMDFLKKKYKNINFIFFPIYKNTKGASETIKLLLESFSNNQLDEPVISIDADNFYIDNIIERWNGENTIITFNSTDINPRFSYINPEIPIKQIVEKVKISNIACTGAYGFKSWKSLLKYSQIVCETSNSEPYISHIIQEMINDKHNFGYEIIQNYYSLGTPQQITEFKQQFCFLLDLDGTLVDSDPIYVKVWNEILKQYNLVVDNNLFNNLIKGKSDSEFLEYILPNITLEQKHQISKLKDKLFVKYITKIPYINGSREFLDKIYGSKLAIVTNSNRKSAEILTKDIKYDILITASDCKNTKPNAEPYLKAIEYLKAVSDKTFIIEDSGTGYLSAKSTNFPNIILINNENTKEFDEIKINNFNEIDFNKLFFNFKKQNDEYILEIKLKLKNYPIKKIKKNEINLKMGYICNIYSYKLYYNNLKEDIVLKIANYANELSNTASELDMYNKEIYFYEEISKYININVPKYYGTIMEHGIIMEQLKNGQFNIDLNNNINILLKIVYEISQMHNKYYFKSKNEIIENIKKLKKPNEIKYYNDLINNRFKIFLDKNKLLLSKKEYELLINIKKNYDKIQNELSEFPLSFCHGDLKSPNLFYKDNGEIYYLDWQYIHLNKGISDIVFLLIESLKFNKNICDIVYKYYYELVKNMYKSYQNYKKDFINALQSFPFFVMVWFGSTDNDKLLDKSFPIRFMKNLLKYYNYYLI